MQNTLGETTVVKSLATTIHKRLVNPGEEQYRQLDNRINDLIIGSRELHTDLQEELNKLIALHRNTRLITFSALTLTIINFLFFVIK